MEYSIQQLKEDIKQLASRQKVVKQNRKTVNFRGTRELEPWDAAMTARRNKYELRHMYLAYDKARGRELPSDLNPEKYWLGYVDRILGKYEDRKGAAA